jgi:ATP-independent RNA helicase DbpA
MIAKILEKLKIESLNEMQLTSLDVSEKEGDIVLFSPTGSGKTLGFLLPLFKRLDPTVKGIQALILVPSRELALQIEQVFKQMGTGFKVNCCYGGHSVKIECDNLSEAPSVLVGTPGRISFHLQSNNFTTDTIQTLVLDEFDKSLEFGFQEDMSFIISQLKNLSKRILTSATKMAEIPAFTGVEEYLEVNFLSDTPTKLIGLKQKYVVAKGSDKLESLFKLICMLNNRTTLVFCNHRDAVERISDILWNMGLAHGIFHGGMEQKDREKALIKFRNGSHRILVTTDLASRGLDIPEIEFVVHYQLPLTEDAYIHRNGRTARMNSMGTSYLVLTEADKLPKFIKEKPAKETLPNNPKIPENSPWCTLYLAAGKKDKINKVDIVGFLMQKGKLAKDELGLIEVLDNSSYAAVARTKITALLANLKHERIKNQKVKMAISE